MSEWYYVSGDEQKGPVSAAELRSLARAGSIVNGTLVWKPGLTKWVPAHVVKGMFSEHAEQVAPPPVPNRNGAAAAAAATPGPAATTSTAPRRPRQVQPRALPVAVPGEPSRFCRTCGKSIALQAVACTGCGCDPQSGQHYCPACGSQTLETAIVCIHCGSGLHRAMEAQGAKSRIAAGVLALLLGCFGVHNFYLGHVSRGLVQIMLTVLGLFLLGIPTIACYVWALVEGVALLTGRINVDARGNELRG